MSRFACAFVAAASLAATPSIARAVECTALPGEKVYLQIGDTQQPLIKELARHLRDSASKPLTLVYVTSGSCTNIEAFYNQTPITTNALYVPSAAEDPGWTTADPPLQCEVPVEGLPVDIANSNVFVNACDPSEPPAGVRLVQGPVQAYVLVVPEASTQVAITAEEGYFAFGFGAAGMAAPWVNEALMFIRPVTKSTLLAWAAALSVPAAKWKGARLDTSSEVLAAVSNAVDPQAAIGILGAEIYDQHRDVVNALAFRAFGQKRAYFPDSTRTSFDKQNLRDGHYTGLVAHGVPPARLCPPECPSVGNAQYVVNAILGASNCPGAGLQSVGGGDRQWPGFPIARLQVTRFGGRRRGYRCTRRPSPVGASMSRRWQRLHAPRATKAVRALLAPVATATARRSDSPGEDSHADSISKEALLDVPALHRPGAAAVWPAAMASRGRRGMRAAPMGTDAGADEPTCYEAPTTHLEIIQWRAPTPEAIAKDPALPLLNADGSLPPLP